MTCPIDARPLLNNATICATCESNLERALGDLDALLDDLDTTLTRQARRRPARGNHANDGPPMPYDERASGAERELYMLLKDIVGSVAIELSKEGKFVELPMPPTSRNLSTWLLHHVHWIAHHYTAPDTYSEIVGAVNNIRRTIDIAPDTRYVGPCGSEIDNVECTEVLYAPEGSDTARCRTCSTVWDIAERTGNVVAHATMIAWDATTLSRSLKLGDVALTTDRIKTWTNRGHLKPYGLSHRGNRTYIVAHVARLITMYETGQKLSPWPEQEQETA